MVRASASQSVDLGFIPLVESYQRTLKNDIHSFPAWRSALNGGCGEQAGKSLAVSLGKALNGTPRLYVEDRWPRHQETATPKRVRTSRPKYSNTIRFLVNGG